VVPDIFPVLLAAIECPTHSIIDAAMRSLPVVLPVLDFSTIKNELFPVLAAVFTRTNSLAIKVRGLQSFVILCGGSTDAAADDGLNGLVAQPKKTSSSSALDKYTMQEKIVPLIKGIKTKEPAVMMAALNVLRIVGQSADAEFVAMDILPILWSMSLGPLLELKQFQTFMELIKLLSRKVEDEQTRKLQELSGSNGSTSAQNTDFLSFGGVTGTAFDQSNGASEDDFESLVKGRTSTSAAPANGSFASWDDSTPKASSISSAPRSSTSTPQTPAFSWSTPPTATPTSPPSQAAAVKSQQSSFRTVTPDLNRFESLTPSSTQFSQPMQPTQPSSSFSQPARQQQQQPTLSSSTSTSSINWSSAAAAPAASNPWASSSTAPNYTSNTQSNLGNMTSSMSNLSMNTSRPSMPTSNSRGSSFSLPPPPGATPSSSGSAFSIQPPQQQQQQSSWANMGQQTPSSVGMNTMIGTAGSGGVQQKPAQPQQQQQSKSGLDKYQSLI
jgi:SCY1-like protein 2